MIDVRTVNTAEPDRDKDLRSPDWFDVTLFPIMRLVSTRIEPESTPNTFRAIGTLSLHGVDKTVAIDVSIRVTSETNTAFTITVTRRRLSSTVAISDSTR